jgi:nicotinamide mononucleotide adenylyltransferase
MIKKIVAIYPGRFQPMGQHHVKAFKWLQQQFGADTYIATSDVVNLPKSPFNFKEDRKSVV